MEQKGCDPGGKAAFQNRGTAPISSHRQDDAGGFSVVTRTKTREINAKTH